MAELTWQPSPAADISYYNVYCSTQSEPSAVQENRVASPTEPRLLDWGLQAGTRYHYVLTAVDRAGNESAPCAEAVVQTPAISRVVQHIPVNKTLGGTPVAVSVDAPGNDRYLLWIELKANHVGGGESFDGDMEGSLVGHTVLVPFGSPVRTLGVGLDGLRVVSVQPMWDYVTTAHDNPVPTPFFDTLKSDGQCDPWYALKAGEHRLELTLPGGSAEIVSLTLTNDAGYLPDGITRFRHSQ